MKRKDDQSAKSENYQDLEVSEVLEADEQESIVGGKFGSFRERLTNFVTNAAGGDFTAEFVDDKVRRQTKKAQTITFVDPSGNALNNNGFEREREPNPRGNRPVKTKNTRKGHCH